MAKKIKMCDLIDKFSELYRAESKKKREIRDKYFSAVITLNEHKKDGLQNITVAEYEKLKEQVQTLGKESELQERYCNGIFASREILMEYGFDATVEIDKHIGG